MSGEQAALDFAAGQRAKERGIAKAESRAPKLAETVRAYLREIASDGRAVDIDDARDWLDSLGIEAPSPAWWGCIFRSTEWELVGFSPSRRPAKHAHRNSRWKLRRTA